MVIVTIFILIILKSMAKVKKKVPLWLPYTSKITVKNTHVSFEYKGGEYSDDVKNIYTQEIQRLIDQTMDGIK